MSEFKNKTIQKGSGKDFFLICRILDRLENKEEILEVLKEVIKPGDVVLLKASNGMKFYELAERMICLWKKKD